MNYKVISNTNKQSKQIILCLGFFDGMHLGHQELVKKTLELAKEKDTKAGLVTFLDFPSTKEVKRNSKKILMLNEEKEEYLNNYDLDEIIYISFDEECKKTSKEDFVKFLKEKFNCVGVVVGKDYRFGYKGEGNVDYLFSLNSEDFLVSIVPPVTHDNEIISTTKIINLLLNGVVEKANVFLGRKYSFKGIVNEGFHVGKTLNFPTANVEIDEKKLIPLYGVYAVSIYIEGEDKEYLGMANIGIRPSINTLKKPLIEVHIFNFKKEIYNRKIKINLLKFIRQEKKFEVLEELQKQIKIDKKKCLNYFNS